MAIGKARAAVWSTSDSTLRLYEMDSSDVFQQVSSVAHTIFAGSQTPHLFFSQNEDFLLTGRFTASNSFAITSLDELLATLGTSNITSGSPRVNADNDNFGALLTSISGNAGMFWADTVTGAIGAVSFTTPLGQAGVIYRDFSSNGMDLISLFSSAPYVRLSHATTIGGVAPNNYPNLPAPTSQSLFTAQAIISRFSVDGAAVFFGDAAGAFYVCPFNAAGGANAVGASVQTIGGTGSVRAIAVSPDDKFVAVSRNNGGVFTTEVYTRSGLTLTPFQTIANFGSALDFTGDGFFLVDGLTKQARKFAGASFVDANASMANLPVVVTSFALSRHVDGVNGFARVYQNAVFDYTDCGVDETALKFMLLSSSASFVAADATVSQVSNAGAWEVSGGGWVSGGPPLQNVTHTVNVGGETEITADTVTVTMTGDITFRYGLVYDSVNDTPLALIDYLEDHTASALTTLEFDFSSPGWLKFTPV